MAPSKPKVFLASSGAAFEMVKALNRCLKKENINCIEWKADSNFKTYPYPDLLKAASECQYAVFVMWPDDVLQSSSTTHVTRDNVIFEAGLFAGVLNPNLWKHSLITEKCVFLWRNRNHTDLHIPTDLDGFNQARYSFSGDIKSAKLSDLVAEIETDARVLAEDILNHWNTTQHKQVEENLLDRSILGCFKREWTTAPPKPPPLPSNPNRVLLDLDDVYDSLVSSGGSPKKGVAIIDKDTRWCWDLFPILLYWRSLDYPVSVVTEAPSASKADHEKLRMDLLIGLGCEVSVQPVKERLFVLNPDKSSDTIVFQFENERHYIATRRTRNGDPTAVDDVDCQIAAYGLTFIPSGTPPTIIAADESEIINKLISNNGPPAYQAPSVTMKMEDINIEDSFSISLVSRSYRFRQTDLLIALLKKNGIPLFEPAAVLLKNGVKSFITPPVVEDWGGRYIFIEGNTRGLHSFCSNTKKIRCLVVKGVTDQPPATEVAFDQVFMCRLKLPAAWRQLDWNYNTFRNIEAAVHNF